MYAIEDHIPAVPGPLDLPINEKKSKGRIQLGNLLHTNRQRDRKRSTTKT